MVETARPGGPGDASSILRQILAALTIPGEGSASQLILEVRNALKGTSEPTVRDSIVDLKNAIQHEFSVLRAALRDEGGSGHGGTVLPRAGPESGESRQLRESIVDLVRNMDNVMLRLERATIVREGGEHGQRDVPSGIFQRENALNTARAVEEFLKGTSNATTVLGLFGQQLNIQSEAITKDFKVALLNLALQTTNVSSQFRNFNSVLRQEIEGLQTHGVFGSNALGPMEYFMEGPKRLMSGMLLETDSFRTALKAVHQALQDDMISPLSMTGRDTVEFARDLHAARADMRNARDNASNMRGWMSTDEANKALVDMLEFQHRMGIKSLTNDILTEQNTSIELNYLKIIAAMTGQTVGALEQQVKSQMRQQEILAGLGRLTSDELKMSAEISTGVSNRAGEKDTKVLFDLMNQLTYYGKNRGEILANAPDEVRKLFSTQSETMERVLQLMELRKAPLQAGETMDARTQQFLDAISAMKPALDAFGGSGATNQRAAAGSMQDTLAQLRILSNQVSTMGAPTAAQRARGGDDPVYTMLGTIKEVWQQYIVPFLALPSALTVNTAAIGANTIALLGIRGGLFSGIAGAAGFAGKATRFLGSAAAIGGAAYGAYDVGSNYMSGHTGAAVGGTAGMLAGGVAGSFVSPIIGTAVGAAIGEKVGSWLGSHFGSAEIAPSGPRSAPSPPSPPSAAIGDQLPTWLPTWLSRRFGSAEIAPSTVAEQASHLGSAVSPPANVAGPNLANVGAAVASQDNNLSLLTEIAQINAQGNYIMGQVYGELARQTGYLRGDPNGAGGGVPYNGQGLNTVTPPVAMDGRPGASTSWVGNS